MKCAKVPSLLQRAYYCLWRLMRRQIRYIYIYIYIYLFIYLYTLIYNFMFFFIFLHRLL